MTANPSPMSTMAGTRGLKPLEATLAHKMVSVIIPCRNEHGFVKACLDSLLANDYPKSAVELLVIDGESSDGTLDVLRDYMRHHPFIRVLTNANRSIPHALNMGIEHAKGEILIRADAHCTYSRAYLAECVRHLETSGADNVGGRWVIVPRGEGTLQRAAAAALSHRFGVGNATYRLSSTNELDSPRWVRTVPFFACRRQLFENVGLFDTRLARSEDVDFSRRLEQQGYRTLLVPTITSNYYARTSPGELFRHSFENGRWAIRPVWLTGRLGVSIRHLVPLAFVGSIVLLGLAGIVWKPSLTLASVVLGTYLAVSTGAGLIIGAVKRDMALGIAAIPMFWILHIAYGLGSLDSTMHLAAMWCRVRWSNMLRTLHGFRRHES